MYNKTKISFSLLLATYTSEYIENLRKYENASSPDSKLFKGTKKLTNDELNALLCHFEEELLSTLGSAIEEAPSPC